ncbi:MAG TPA: TatD family hydrolase [Candidatus Hydrogenedentes bacterium]|nr:TatD family hydrolase [Candidatus Hydrogenedentota bacterium]
MFQPIDSHCHVQDPRFDADRDAVLDQALACLSAVVVVGDTLENSERAVTLAARSRVRAVVGIHPYHASLVTNALIEQLRDLVARYPDRIVAIGETGLDYYNEFSPRSNQWKSFEKQARLASELNLPLVIHNRQADADTLALLREYRSGLPGVIMHCFGSGPAEAEAFAALDCHVSFAGNLTYPRAQALRDAARRVPDHQLLVETDAPYLAPQPVRGRRCEPSHVIHTVNALAVLRNEPVETTADRVARNAMAVYRLDPGGLSISAAEGLPDA